MRPIFKNQQRKRRSSTVEESESAYSTPSPTITEYDQVNNGVCQVVGNTSFISRVRMSPPVQTDKVLTPLMEASRRGNLQDVKELLAKSNYDINQTDSHSYSALFHAVFSQNAELVEFLLEQKANYRHQAIHGITIFHYCIQHGCDKCMEKLCQYAREDLLPPASPTQRYSLDISDTDGVTPLMLACKAGTGSFVRILLEYGANTDLRSFKGDSAMTFALMNNSVECVKELVVNGRFIDSRSKLHPQGALFTAAHYDETEIVHTLVRFPSYLCQFISEMICRPCRQEEIAVEVALRVVALSQPQEVVEELSLLCVKKASVCMKLLFEVCQGRQMKPQYSLAGVAEAAKWCIKLGKVLRNTTTIPELDPFWRQIELLVQQQRLKYQHRVDSVKVIGSSVEGPVDSINPIENHIDHRNPDNPLDNHITSENSLPTPCETTEYNAPHEQRTEAESHEEIHTEDKGKIIPSSFTRLLLSFLEIYVIGHYNLSTHMKEDKEQSLHRLQSLSCLDNRLLVFFTTYKDYIVCLVESDPAVYDMLHFFKHSFTLFLQNC